MRFISTNNQVDPQSLSQAILAGLASDGGLYLPETFPKLDWRTFSKELTYAQFAENLLQPFFANDPLEKNLAAFCQKAFNFPLVLKPLDAKTSVLELFHGPTLSFKDFGARFLAECLNELSAREKTTIMVATSGDTGSAVAAAFYLKNHLQVMVLYPKGKISDRQEQQITCWDHNVLALAIEGNFDDCQSLVKAAFNNRDLRTRFHLSSANSINIGRLLPQMTYYAYTSLQYFHQHQRMPSFIIPTGNLGNATAAYWARALGFPIDEIALACNANTVLPDYLQSGQFSPRPSIATLANAMDVGNPSNFARLLNLYPQFEAFKQQVRAFSVSDEEIRRTIQAVYQKQHYLACPHTATAFYAREHLPKDQDWIVVATADPCKFDEIIEPLVGISIPVAAPLQALLDRPKKIITVRAELREIGRYLEAIDK